jgi:hypothetical protein
MGDNECRVTVERARGVCRNRGAFVLNIGNNDIEGNKTGWVKKVMDMGVRVEEAER